MYRSTDFRRPAVGYNINKANCRATLENIITYYVLKLWEKKRTMATSKASLENSEMNKFPNVLS